jgi:hypothetical protein
MADNLNVGEGVTIGLYTSSGPWAPEISDTISIRDVTMVFMRPQYRLSPTPSGGGGPAEQHSRMFKEEVTGEISIIV